MSRKSQERMLKMWNRDMERLHRKLVKERKTGKPMERKKPNAWGIDY